MFDQLFGRGDGFDALRIAIAGASLTISAIYLALAGKPPSPARTAVKTAAIGVLAAWPLTYLGATGAVPLVALTLALALSALGDFLLALKDQSRAFLFGLGAFLVAHLAYLAAYLPHTQPLRGLPLIALITTLTAAGVFVAILLPRLDRKMKPAVIAYFTVIMAMAAAALSIPGASWMLGVGAVIFAVSDSLIAVRRFLSPFPSVNVAIWATYVAAQFMMTTAFLALIVP